MPKRASRPCRHGGCKRVATEDGFCAAHVATGGSRKRADRWRGSPASRGYDADWRRVRKLALERDRHLCQDCLQRGIVTPANEVHHNVLVEIDPSRRLDLTNLISLCKSCHSRITATRDSSFARRTGKAYEPARHPQLDRLLPSSGGRRKPVDGEVPPRDGPLPMR